MNNDKENLKDENTIKEKTADISEEIKETEEFKKYIEIEVDDEKDETSETVSEPVKKRKK